MILDHDIQYVHVNEEMLEYARGLCEEMQMNRTIHNETQTLTGILGELIFAEWLYGDWKRGNSIEEMRSNFGKPDFEGRIEVKTSCHEFKWELNLLVRKDYNEKRTPQFYVQVLLNQPSKEITYTPEALIIGWIDGESAHKGQVKAMAGVKDFECAHTPFVDLEPIEELRKYL